MVDLSSLSRSVGNDPVATSAARAQSAQSKIEKLKKKLQASKGLGLADIPGESPYVAVSNASDAGEVASASVEAPEFAERVAPRPSLGGDDIVDENILYQIDYELAETQAQLKKILSKKIKLADKDAERKHEYLVSAFEDCKHAWNKIRAVRDLIAE